MNIYGVRAELDMATQAYNIVRAPTRGSARALMAREHDIPFIARMSIGVLEKGVDGGARVLPDEDRLYYLWMCKGLEKHLEYE